MSHTKKVIVCGSFRKRDYENYWYQILPELGWQTKSFSYMDTLRLICPHRYVYSLLWRIGQPLLATYLSRAFKQLVTQFRPDLVLVVNGRFINRDALEYTRKTTGAILFHYYGEYIPNPLNTTQTILTALDTYDAWFTANPHNIPELQKRNVKYAQVVPFGYIPDCYQPIELTKYSGKLQQSDISFVGTYEHERAAVLEQICDFDLKVWGAYWNRLNQRSPLRRMVQGREVECTEMAVIYKTSKICLSFFRKANRDEHTSRNFAIPACGGFQLSERSNLILDFFDEGREIECFDSVDELRDKIRYYLAHPEQREIIAKAGYDRAISSGYSQKDRLMSILDIYYSQFAWSA